jgi:cytochrome P450
MVSRWEDIAFITEHPEIFGVGDPPGSTAAAAGYRGGSGDGGAAYDFDYSPSAVPSSNPPEHRLKRTFTAPIVARDHLARYEPRIRAIANELIDAFIDAGECDFMAQFAGPLPIYVIGEIIGFPREDGPLLWEWTGGVGLSAQFLPPELQAKDAEGQRRLDDYVRQAILSRHERPTDDWLSELIQAQLAHDGGRLNLAYLTTETTIMIHAGNSTTAFMLANAMMLLLQHPETMARVRADRSLIAPMLEEALRVETPVQWTLRYARTDTRLGDVEIPAGARLLINWAAGNRDERKFECPEEFRIDRPGVVKHHFGFGRGIHLCLGAPLARLEGLISFEAIFDRLVNIRPAEGKNDFTHVELANKRAPKALHITFDRPAGG